MSVYIHQVSCKCNYPLPTQSRPMSEDEIRKRTFPMPNKDLISFSTESVSMERDAAEFLRKTNDCL